jgi:FkbM family methyltransferase
MRERIAARITKTMKRLEGLVYDSQQVGNSLVRVPIISGLRCGMSEKWMLRVLEFSLPHSPGAFVDVGVNLGQTLIKLRALDQQRKYVGFEPNPVCIFYLQELIRTNRYQNCTLVPVGLFTETSILSLDLFTATPADSAASLIQNFRPGEKVHDSVLVPVFTFAQVASAAKLDDIGLVKIDVEGAELEVLRSLRDEIARHRPLLLIEILPPYHADNAPRIQRQSEIHGLLDDLRYKVFRIHKTSHDDYRELRLLDAFDIHGDLTMCDYLCVPGERADALLHASTRTNR